MEVVNRLTQAVELPAEFVTLFISNCIVACESLRVKEEQTQSDRYILNRLVRLVCVFVTSLISNRFLDVGPESPILVELQAFCMNHGHNREANELFRKLKEIHP